MVKIYADKKKDQKEFGETRHFQITPKKVFYYKMSPDCNIEYFSLKILI